MTVDDSLARLRAGLDEDERIARAALEGPARLESEWEVVEYANLGTPVTSVADSSGVQLAPEIGKASPHIAHHDPARALRQVEAFRRIEECSEPDAFEDHIQRTYVDPAAFREGVTVVVEYMLAALASIYPTEES